MGNTCVEPSPPGEVPSSDGETRRVQGRHIPKRACRAGTRNTERPQGLLTRSPGEGNDRAEVRNARAQGKPVKQTARARRSPVAKKEVDTNQTQVATRRGLDPLEDSSLEAPNDPRHSLLKKWPAMPPKTCHSPLDANAVPRSRQALNKPPPPRARQSRPGQSVNNRKGRRRRRRQETIGAPQTLRQASSASPEPTARETHQRRCQKILQGQTKARIERVLKQCL